MFGFPTDLFGIPNNSQSLFGNALMIPSSFNNLMNNFGMNSSPFAIMDRMMQNVNQNSNAPMQSFTSTTVMSYNGTDGRPKVYQETTSRNRGPGGIEETRQAIRDTERGINKVQIGHRIGDRKHVIEREMNVETGQISENVELENLDETETDDFKNEWRQRSTRAGLHRHSYHPYHRQINSNRSHRPQLAIEHASSRNVHRTPDTIDLTEDDIEEIEQLPSPVKRQVSSNDVRKHRQNRF
jgi:hypothetical protein